MRWGSVGNSVHYSLGPGVSYRTGRRPALPGEPLARRGLTWILKADGAPIGAYSSLAKAKAAAEDHRKGVK